MACIKYDDGPTTGLFRRINLKAQEGVERREEGNSVDGVSHEQVGRIRAVFLFFHARGRELNEVYSQIKLDLIHRNDIFRPRRNIQHLMISIR